MYTGKIFTVIAGNYPIDKLFILILLLDIQVAHFQLKNPIKEVYDSQRNNEVKEIEEIRKPNGIWVKFKFSGYFLTQT